METAGSPCEKKTCLGSKWTTLLPTPASSRKTARLKVMVLTSAMGMARTRMRSSREQYGSLHGRFRFKVAGNLSSKTQLSKMIHPFSWIGMFIFEHVYRIDVSAPALRDLAAWGRLVCPGAYTACRQGTPG